ncbi:MAG: flavoprotein [Synergistaceae bacterium]|jgi:hypothetical protein|nr:flavoprotein [Synergistaceae bacterium]
MSDRALERIKEDLMEQIMNCLLPLLSKRATVFFTGGKADPAGLLKIVDGLLSAEAGIVASENFLGMAPQEFKTAIDGRLLRNYGAMQKQIAESSLVVVPILTRNTLAKVAAGIEDNLVTCGLAAALMRGIPAIAVRENCDPLGGHFRDIGLDKNPAYNDMLLGHMRKLASFGVKLVETEEFSPALEGALYGGAFASVSASAPAPEKPLVTGAPTSVPTSVIKLTDSFITCEDLMSIPAGAGAQVSKAAVLTPLALEFIESRKIALIRV